MVAGQAAVPNVNDLEMACWLFDRMLLESGASADRPGMRRAMEEASGLWFEEDELWWKWIVETARNLGLRCKVSDCTFDEVKEVLRDGGRIISRISGPENWYAITHFAKGNYQVFNALQEPKGAWVSSGKLGELLQVGQRNQSIRCVIFESLDPLMIPGAVTHEITPLGWLFTLIRPDMQDIGIIAVFAVVTGLLALATPMAVETLVNTVAFGSAVQPVVVLALMLLSFLSFSAALRGLQTYVVEIIQRRLFARVAADLAYRLPRVEATALEGISARSLVNRFFDIITVQKVSAQLFLDGFSLVMITMIGMAVLAFYHPWLLGFDIVLLALIAFIVLILGRGAVESSIIESKAKYYTAGWLETLVGCPTAFRTAGGPDFALERADGFVYDYLNARRKHFRVLMRQIVFALGMQAIASTALLGIGGWLVMSNQLTLGQLVASELIVTVIVGSFAKLGKHMESYYDLMAACEKLGSLFELPVERQNGILNLHSAKPLEIQLSEVSLESSSGHAGLDNVSFSIPSGERLVIEAPAVAGSCELMNLLYGTHAPSSGHIRLNKTDPRDMRPDALRRYVALVRNVEVFQGTILENIHLERSHVSHSDVREVLERMHVLDELLMLPDGLETELSDTGYPLTRNQLFKLMLARAIVGRPSLLMVDGALDLFSEEEAEHLVRMLFAPSQPWTVMLVTAKKDLSRFADRSVLLTDGKLSGREENSHGV